VDAKAAAEDGIVIQKAGKTVYLTNDVPPQYLKRMQIDLSEFPVEERPKEPETAAGPQEGPAEERLPEERPPEDEQ
jgi:hypothetical protein